MHTAHTLLLEVSEALQCGPNSFSAAYVSQDGEQVTVAFISNARNPEIFRKQLAGMAAQLLWNLTEQLSQEYIFNAALGTSCCVLTTQQQKKVCSVLEDLDTEVRRMVAPASVDVLALAARVGPQVVNGHRVRALPYRTP